MLFEWSGPFVVINQESEYIYMIENICNNYQTRCHANKMPRFYSGNLTREMLQFEAAENGTYFIDEVFDHRIDGKRYEFFVKYRGYEAVKRDHPEAWTPWENCRFSPAVRKYCKDKNLKPKIK